AQVHAEVDGMLAGRLPNRGDLERLPTCRGLWAEALRLYPPSWAMGREAVEEHRVRDTVIPAGDLVLLPQWVVHRDPRWWRQPLRCDPGRWREGVSRQGPRSAFFPFGGGIRRCIGEGFAETEGVLAIAAIASRWRLVPVPERPLRLDPLLTLRPRDGLWMRPLPRGVGTLHP
ncbi:MAG TPA: cytochrome P450, partial [Egibacteraceae bacterium]|nr:cytochrome P450 [Egibacteraceae bacterium]